MTRAPAAKKESSLIAVFGNPRKSEMRKLIEMTEPELKDYMSGMAALIDSVMPASDNERGKSLFVLLVFDDPGLAQYVSSCDRENMVQALREAADRIESREDIPR